MQRRWSIGVFGMVICILAYGTLSGKSWAQTAAIGLSPPPQAGTFAPLDGPVHVRLENDVMTAEASYVEDIRSLLIEGKRQGFFHLCVSSSLFGDDLTSAAELAYNALEPRMQEDFEERQHQLFRFRLKGQQGIFEHGVEYFYIGKKFEKPAAEKTFENLRGLEKENDREGSQVWGKWRFGMASTRLDFTEFWDNVDNNPQQPRSRTRQGRISLDIAPPSWPFLSLSYARGASHSSQESNSLFDTVDLVLYYGRTTWGVTLSSTYSWTRDKLQPANANVLVYHELSVSYRPTSAISLVPAVRYTARRDSPSQTLYTSLEASLSFTYNGLFGIFDLTTYGSYTSSESTDGFMDTRNLDTTTNLAWPLGKLRGGIITLALEMTYRHFLDLVYPESSYKEISGILLLKVAYTAL
jgi:hypothetical protein